MITHVVMFRLVDSNDVGLAVERLRALSGRIPALKSIRVGPDSNRGPNAYDLVLVSTHDDAAGLRAYVEHPAHQELLSWIGPRIAERAVVDTGDFR